MFALLVCAARLQVRLDAARAKAVTIAVVPNSAATQLKRGCCWLLSCFLPIYDV